MEIEEQITVNIATGAETTTIAGMTTIAQMAIETTIGGGESRGLINAAESGKGEAKVVEELPIGTKDSDLYKLSRGPQLSQRCKKRSNTLEHAEGTRRISS